MPCHAGTEKKASTSMAFVQKTFSCVGMRGVALAWESTGHGFHPPGLQQEPLAQNRGASLCIQVQSLPKTQGASGNAASGSADFLHLPGLGCS